MLGAVKLTKNADPDKYKYSGYGIGFDCCSFSSLPDNTMRKNGIIFGADMNSSVHVDNKGKDILIYGKGPTQRLDDTTLTAEAKYSINFTQSNRRFCSSFHYNGSNSVLFVNATKICQFKAKDSEIKNDFTAINMKKTRLNGYVYEFSLGYNTIDTSNVINIHKYLMKKHDIK